MGCSSYNYASQEEYIVKLSKKLVSQGHKHYIVYENFPENKEFTLRLRNSGAKLIKIEPQRRLIKKVKNKYVRKFLIPFYDMFDFKAIITIYKVIKKYKIDIVHSYFLDSLYAVFIAKLMGKKTCKTFSNPFISIANKKQPSIAKKMYLFVRYILPMYFVDKNIAISETVKNDMLSYDFFKDKVELIYSGVNTKVFDTSNYRKGHLRKELEVSSSTILIGYTGRLDSKQKNLFFSLDIIKEIIAKHKNIKFVIVGGGTDNNNFWKSKLIDYSKEIGVENNVIFLGRRSDISQILVDIDIFLINSFFEGFCSSLIESMSMELPCVTSNAETFREIISNEEDGFVCDLDNISTFTNSINKLISNKSLRKKIGANARKKVLTNFDVNLRVENTINLYRGFYV